MKKLIALLLSLLVVVGLFAGCTQEGTEQSGTTAPAGTEDGEDTTAGADDGYVVGYICKDLS